MVSGSVIPWRVSMSVHAAGTPRSEKEEMRDSDRKRVAYSIGFLERAAPGEYPTALQ